MKRILCLAVLMCGIVLLPAPSPMAAVTTIKIAVVMPEGSTWTNTLREFSQAVTTATRGEVVFKIYPGGISGDEVDVLRKMQVNRLHAGGFSGVGLGLVLPEIRVLEAPLLFNSHAEIDYVKQHMFDTFAQRFEKKGYVLLGFAEAGFVYLFSKHRIDSMESLRHSRMWVWKGDRVAEIFLQAFGVQAYPLQLVDVNTGLETGMIDSYYSPPLASVAFQWYPKVRYMLDFPMVNSTGALLMNKRTYYSLSPAHRDIVRRLVHTYTSKLVRLTRKDNAEALQVLEEAGIKRIPPIPEQIAAFRRSAKRNYEMSVPTLYSAELLAQIQELIADHRKGLN